jgi:hypothetical protein
MIRSASFGAIPAILGRLHPFSFPGDPFGVSSELFLFQQTHFVFK